jgi:cytochrome c oxidase cbb3-type subunit 3
MIMFLLVTEILLTGCSSEPAGAELYKLNCAACHGPAGKGGLATGLSPPAYLATHDDRTMTRLIREGLPNTGMRAFGKANGGTLTDEQITTILRYLRTTGSGN